jgi:selenocysteine lyase/cysteine desulfurase
MAGAGWQAEVEMLSSEFTPAGAYLDSATYGLPPARAVNALTSATAQWADGTYDPLSCDAAVARTRDSFARMHGVLPTDVAIGHQVSPLVAAVAGGLPAGALVLTTDGDFTSLLFPFVAAGAHVEAVPLERLADAVDSRTDVVAVSAVQSADGRVADLEALAVAAADNGALTIVDATQAAGWLPLDASRFDVMVAGGYKWLCHPRGTAFMTVRASALDRLRPANAGWYAGERPWDTCYGLPLRLAADARRFDISPAWLSWHAAAAAAELFEQIGLAHIHAHDLELANRLRRGVGLPEAESAIVSFTADPGAGERLRAAGVKTSVRAGRVRISPHLYNDAADVDRALEALGSDAGRPSRRPGARGGTAIGSPSGD